MNDTGYSMGMFFGDSAAMRFLSMLLVSLLFAGTCVQRASGELPAFQDAPWLGYFAVFNLAHTQLRITSQGAISLVYAANKREVSPQTSLPVEILVEEVIPGGKTVERLVDPSALESSQGPAENPEQIMLKGQAEGGILVEIQIEQMRGVVSFGGRVLDPGSHARKALGFAMRISFPATHTKPEPTADKRATIANDKAFEKRIAKDFVRARQIDGKGLKLSLEKIVKGVPEDLNAPGIAELEVDTTAFGGAGFRFAATPNSRIAFASAVAAPLYRGFTIVWRGDAAQNSNTNERLSMRVK